MKIWLVHVACMGEITAHKMLRWEDNIRIDVKEITCNDM
jgi:hypothetical protein